MSFKLILQYPVPISLEGTFPTSFSFSTRAGKGSCGWFFRRQPVLPQSTHWESGDASSSEVKVDEEDPVLLRIT